MTYEEAYNSCDTLEQLNKMVNKDIVVANFINPDRLKQIAIASEKVANAKFKEG